MKTRLRILAFALMLWQVSGSAWAEGSRNLTPGTRTDASTLATNDRCGFLVHDSDQNSGGVDISYGFLKPASWVSPAGVPFSEDYRLFVRLLPGEKLSYGVQRANDANYNSSAYRNLVLTLRYGTGDGTIVKQNTLTRGTTGNFALLATNQAGVIDDYAQAAAGPFPAAGGYSPLEYTNNTNAPRDFFIEFTQEGEYTNSGTQAGFNDLKTRSATFVNTTTGVSGANRIYSVYNLWDFTVTGTDNQVKNGRLFSKSWAFSSLAPTNLLSNTFTLYPMVESRTTASSYYVKAIELAGLRPYAFFFVTNEFGSTPATGRTTVADRRKSQANNTAYAQYPSFVNNPDQVIWPSAIVPTVAITPQPYCRNGNTEVAFTTASSETGRFDINITYGGNTRVLTTDVVGGSSATIIWDGLVNGVRVPSGQTITYNFTNRGATVNFPLYDAENNEGGFVVRNVRPSAAGADALYWDDTNIPALNTSSPSDGTISPAHAWGSSTTTPGNATTVNTWVYGFVSTANNLSYTTVDICDNDDDGVTDANDIDDDNDGILDVVEAISGTASVDPGAFADATSPIRYLDVDYVHPVFGAFRDLNNDGVNDIFDTDRDGIPNQFDLDSDNDGLTDSFEAGLTSLTWASTNGVSTNGYNVAQGRFINTLGTLANSVGANGLPNAVENRGTGVGDARIGGNDTNTVRYTLTDTDNDTFTANSQTVRNYNFLDIDSDNDGITDEMEALTTNVYNTRKVQSNFNTDTDRDGIRDAYDGNVTGGNVITTRTDTDGDGTADMFDQDSDNDNATRTSLPITRQTSDWSEGFDTDGNGSAGTEILAKAAAFAVANSAKASYYPASAGLASDFLQDSDNDRIPNFLDVDSPFYHDDNFNGLADIYDPAYNGLPSAAPKRTAGQSDADFRTSSVATPLPVELKSFEATASNTNANLTWSTASEKNNDHFKVERSFNGGDFEQIGQVQGRGNTSQTTNYSFTDTNVGTKRAGVVYYRLQQVDTDGTTSYSPVRTVSFAAGLKAGVATVGVYPNPATSQNRTVTLALTTLPTGTYEVTVLDAMGRIVRTQSVQGGQDQTLDVQQLSTGMYLVQVRGSAINLTQRFSKQ